MSSRRLLLSVVALSIVAFAPRAVADDTASATLPLERVLELLEGQDTEREEPRPLVDAALQSLAFEGRLLDDAIDLRVDCEVAVLEQEAWVKVPVLPLDGGVHLGPLPDLARGAFLREEGALFFTVRGAGSYRFELSLRMEASREGTLRRVAVARGAAPAVSMRLDFDETLFRLRSAVASRDAQGATLLPDTTGFSLEWEQRESAPVVAVAPRPPIEARVEALHASSVATLEGERVTRALYRLRFAGNETIAFELPEGVRLLRAYRNGIAVKLDPEPEEPRRLQLALTPAQRGGESGSVELVLGRESREGFHLDGQIRFVFPRCSWPTREVFVDAHLPAVFQYQWRGGSLAQSETTPRTDYSYPLPTPGTQLRFHQVLVSSSAPDLELDYAVDLAGHYFRGKGGR